MIRAGDFSRDAATGPLALTTPSPKLTPLLGQEAAAQCTL